MVGLSIFTQASPRISSPKDQPKVSQRHPGGTTLRPGPRVQCMHATGGGEESPQSSSQAPLRPCKLRGSVTKHSWVRLVGKAAEPVFVTGVSSKSVWVVYDGKLTKVALESVALVAPAAERQTLQSSKPTASVMSVSPARLARRVSFSRRKDSSVAPADDTLRTEGYATSA